MLDPRHEDAVARFQPSHLFGNKYAVDVWGFVLVFVLAVARHVFVVCAAHSVAMRTVSLSSCRRCLRQPRAGVAERQLPQNEVVRLRDCYGLGVCEEAIIVLDHAEVKHEVAVRVLAVLDSAV